MNWQAIAYSLVAIVILALVARWLRLGESRIGNAGAARRFAEDALVGFTGGRALVAANGNAALVAGDGAIAVLKRHGARVAVRRLLPPLSLAETAEGVVIHSSERMFGRVPIHGITIDQVRALEAEVARAYTTIQ